MATTATIEARQEAKAVAAPVNRSYGYEFISGLCHRCDCEWLGMEGQNVCPECGSADCDFEGTDEEGDGIVQAGNQQKESLLWVNTPGYSLREAGGMPLHAVPSGSNRTLCGTRRSEWGFDLFNVDKCKKCLEVMAKKAKASK